MDARSVPESSHSVDASTFWAGGGEGVYTKVQQAGMTNLVMNSTVGRQGHRAVLISLSILIVSLVIVGAVNGTVLRQVVQIVPATIVAALLLQGQAWARCSALAVFLFWLTMLALIWFFLFGIVTVFGAQFTLFEKTLTVVIGSSCFVGSLAVVRGPKVRGLRAFLAFLGGTGVQLLAMWLSFQHQFMRG